MKLELNAVWMGVGTAFALTLLAASSSMQSRSSDSRITVETKALGVESAESDLSSR